MKKTSKAYQAAVYLKLSREDGDAAAEKKKESNSIANQRELIFDYVCNTGNIL